MRARAAVGHGADRVYVEYQDLDRVPARVVGWDVFDDVALIQVDPQDHALAPVPLGDSSAVAVGEPVAAIGSPFGQEDSLGVGVVSATHRSIESLTSKYSLVDAIQTDAPINHGNSGGPLFDARGRVIGINAQIRSDSGTAEGVGFAVPIDSARRSMEQLVAERQGLVRVRRDHHLEPDARIREALPLRRHRRCGDYRRSWSRLAGQDAGLHGRRTPRRTSASSSRPTPM